MLRKHLQNLVNLIRAEGVKNSKVSKFEYIECLSYEFLWLNRHSISVLHLREDSFNICYCEFSESRIIDWGKSYLNIICLKVTVYNILKHLYCSLNSFFLCPVTLALLELLLELSYCFLLFCTCCDCLKSDRLAWWIHSVNLWALFNITANKSDYDTGSSDTWVLWVLLHKAS